MIVAILCVTNVTNVNAANSKRKTNIGSLTSGIVPILAVSYRDAKVIDTDLMKQKEYKAKYDASLKYHDEINEKIFSIREDTTLSNYEKVCKIGVLLCEKGNIRYKSGSNLFNWDNELLDPDFNEIGCYYKDGMTFDCSGFMQYLIWISTGKSLHDGILIGRGTYFSSIEGISVKQEDLQAGMLCFRYNGGSGVVRTGESLLKNETKTKDSNHMALYLGDGKYLDCSESYGGVRIVDTKENPYYLEFYTWYRDVLQDPNYITNLEIQYQELL